MILPGGWGIIRIILFARVVFPAPVSPTSPSVIPSSRDKSIPFNAFTIPSLVSYWTLRSLISNSFPIRVSSIIS